MLDRIEQRSQSCGETVHTYTWSGRNDLPVGKYWMGFNVLQRADAHVLAGCGGLS
jgi:hypothetical protein